MYLKIYNLKFVSSLIILLNMGCICDESYYFWKYTFWDKVARVSPALFYRQLNRTRKYAKCGEISMRKGGMYTQMPGG